MSSIERKPCHWIGSSLEDLRSFPEDVKDVLGDALAVAQEGGKDTRAKPLKGFKGSSVVEIVDDYDGDTYRAVYTVKFAGVLYVLHAFQKKSKTGISTPKHELELIERRLKLAESDYKKQQSEKMK